MDHQEDHLAGGQEEDHQGEVRQAEDHQGEVRQAEDHQVGVHQCPSLQLQSYKEEGTTN
jgi:hypothetical protein